jgi:hypothetical protein
MKKSAKCCKSQPSNPFGRLQTIFPVPTFFGGRFVGKEIGLLTYKPPSHELGDSRDWCIKRLRNLNKNKILKLKEKKFKTHTL